MISIKEVMTIPINVKVPNAIHIECAILPNLNPHQIVGNSYTRIRLLLAS